MGQKSNKDTSWRKLYISERAMRLEEMVRSAGLAEQCSEILHALAQVVAHPECEDAQRLGVEVLEKYKQLGGCSDR